MDKPFDKMKTAELEEAIGIYKSLVPEIEVPASFEKNADRVAFLTSVEVEYGKAKQLTAEDLAADPTLEENGLEVGDFVLVPSEQFSEKLSDRLSDEEIAALENSTDPTIPNKKEEPAKEDKKPARRGVSGETPKSTADVKVEVFNGHQVISTSNRLINGRSYLDVRLSDGTVSTVTREEYEAGVVKK